MVQLVVRQPRLTTSRPYSTVDHAFREYEDEAYPGHFKTSKTDWDYELARLRKNAPDAMVFEKARGASGVMYRWSRERHLRLVD